MRALKESWKEAPQAIEELEQEGEVFVTRTAKDGQPRMVFWNEIKPTEESGGMSVEKGVHDYHYCHLFFSDVFLEFYDLWHSLSVPNDVDLLKALSSGKSALCLIRICIILKAMIQMVWQRRLLR